MGDLCQLRLNGHKMLNTSRHTLSANQGETLTFSNKKVQFQLIGDGKLEPCAAAKVEDTFDGGAIDLDSLKAFAKAEKEVYSKLMPFRKSDGSQPTRVGSRMMKKARKSVEHEINQAVAALPGEGWSAGAFHIHNDGNGYTLDVSRESQGVRQKVSVAHNTDWGDDRGNALDFKTSYSQAGQTVNQTLGADLSTKTGSLIPTDEYLTISQE